MHSPQCVRIPVSNLRGQRLRQRYRPHCSPSHTVHTEDVAGGFANLRSDWRHFVVNCGTLADRFLAYTYAEITFLTISPPFLSDFENNGTVEISEFFCVGLAIKNKFLIENVLGFGACPLFEFRYLWGSLTPKGISTTSTLIIRAFCVQI